MLSFLYKLNKQNNKIDSIVDDYKADIDELKIMNIKQEAEIKELKKSGKKNLKRKNACSWHCRRGYCKI